MDDGGDPRVEQAGHGAGDLGPHAGVAGGEGLQPQEHQRPHHLALHPRPHSGGVRADDVALELHAQVGGNVADGEGAEAGGDAVDGVGLGGQVLDGPSGGGERLERLGGEFDGSQTAGDGDDVLGGDAGGPEHHGILHIHIQAH